jgi:ABC-type nitrate/sulfonate/bicarbonate transport system permease component
MLGMAALMLAVMTPFFVAGRLRRFRDEGREGVISFRRSYAYTVFVFFYGAVLLAVAQFLYFAYIDHGYLLSTYSKIVSSAEGRELIQQYGMTQAVDDSLAEMANLRPIDYALNILTVNIMVGLVLGVPIGLVMQRSKSIEH